MAPFLLLLALIIGLYVLWFILCLFFPMSGTALPGRRQDPANFKE